jgi:hypothetical protein
MFFIISRVSTALKQEGFRAEAEEFSRRAFAAHSYDEALSIVLEYADDVSTEDPK